MTTETIVEKKDDFDLVAVFRAAAPEARERKFWITLAVALALHGLILISIIHSAPRQMGDPNAVPGAVSVSFVSEAELRDATTGADGGGATPAPQPTPPPQAVQPPPEPPAEAQPAPAEPQVQPPPAPAAKQPAEPAEAAQPKANELAKAEETKAPETPTLRDSVAADAIPEKKAEETEAAKATKDVEKEAEKPVETPTELTKERPDLLELPHTPPVQQPTQKQQQPTKKQQQQPQQKQAMRTQPNLTMPQDAITTPSYEGRAAGVQRPAGITRSGANDDFARGVIQALRRTMPQMNVLGRVTVKILINLNGNIESVEVLARSENTDLNRAIVFSTKQASFPFPPNGATVDDRTFTITYIYH